MEYAIFYDERSKGAALKQLDGIDNPASIIRTFVAKTYHEALIEAHEINEEVRNSNRIAVILIDSLDEPVYTSIYNILHEYQRIVSGTIEIVNCADLDSFDIICNGDGKNNLLPLNRSLTENNEIYDVVAGTMIVANSDEEGKTVGLSLLEAERIHKFFYLPEIFSFSSNGEDISVIKPAFSLAKIMKQNFIPNISIKQ